MDMKIKNSGNMTFFEAYFGHYKTGRSESF